VRARELPTALAQWRSRRGLGEGARSRRLEYASARKSAQQTLAGWGPGSTTRSTTSRCSWRETRLKIDGAFKFQEVCEPRLRRRTGSHPLYSPPDPEGERSGGTKPSRIIALTMTGRRWPSTSKP